MVVLSWVAAVAVGITFVVAGVSKISVGDQWPDGAVELGIPRWLSRIVPGAELLVGASLIVGLAWPWPAWAALVMLIVFTAVLVRTLARHDRTPCNCFGTRSRAPVGPIHLVRNAVLIVLTVLSLFR